MIKLQAFSISPTAKLGQNATSLSQSIIRLIDLESYKGHYTTVINRTYTTLFAVE